MDSNLIQTCRNIFESRLFNIGKTEINLLIIIEFIFIIVAFYIISRIIRRILKRRVLTHFGMSESGKFVMLRLIHYLVMIVGIMIAFNTVGIQLTSITVGLGVLGVGFAFGLQNITSNFVSGMILLFERHVNVGDFITVGDIIGRVKSIRIRATTIVTVDNVMLIVPNSKFIEDTVTNWSVEDPKLRVPIPIGVAYGSDTDLVTRLLLRAAEEHEEVLKDPAPVVQFRAFGSSSLDFMLLPWISDPTKRIKVISDINYKIDKLFRENNITIPFQQVDVHFFPRGDNL
ncbi:TPA: mechanosensitive ion channel [bacterium]|nr:mechanosensitive ion channel [bacterium]